MSPNLTVDVEWYLAEDVVCESSGPARPALHMGPFASEEECHALLASLSQVPRFRDGALRVHKRRKQRERRIRIELPVLVCRRSMRAKLWRASTVDISNFGARLTGLMEKVEPGEVLEIRHGGRQAAFRVVWVGRVGTATEGDVGMECTNRLSNLWNLESEPDEDIAVARAVQSRLLPSEKPSLQTLDYSANCVQARTVGGDYYDFLDLGPGQVGFVLADVAGKGIAAALLMANLQGSIHSHERAFAAHDLTGWLTTVNQHLYKYTEAARYATLFFGQYDDTNRSLHYVNCGHNPPFLLRGSGTVERLAPTATVLGLFGNWDCSIGKTQLDTGDLLSVFTDGITEARCETGEEFGEDRLLGTLHDSRKLAATAVLRNVEHAVEQFRFGEREDDLTMMIARAK